MNYQILSTLIQTHPQWPTVDTETLTTWVNEEVIGATKSSLPNQKILATILENRSEFSALSAADQQTVRDILYIGDEVPTANGEPVRDTLVSIFGVGSATITSLASAISYDISRAQEAGIIERVRAGDIEYARSLA